MSRWGHGNVIPLSEVFMARQKDVGARRLALLVLSFVVTPTALMMAVGVLRARPA